MTADPFDQLRSALLAQLDPARFRRHPCPSAPLARVPQTGRDLLSNIRQTSDTSL